MLSNLRRMKRRKRVPFLVCVAVVALLPFPAAAQEVPNADLAVLSNAANAKHGHVGQQVTFTILATNNGPDTTPGLFVTATFQGLELVEEICDLGVSADTPSCEYSNIPRGQILTTTVIARIVRTGSRTAALGACVSSPDPINDTDASNDCLTATVKVIGKR
jgi:hypothetical protein